MGTNLVHRVSVVQPFPSISDHLLIIYVINEYINGKQLKYFCYRVFLEWKCFSYALKLQMELDKDLSVDALPKDII